MSPKILISNHAVDVGGVIVEPGGEIPGNADPATVKQLENDGRIRDSGGSKQPQSKQSSKGE